MTTEPRKKRGHAALGARILVAGAGSAATIALGALMARADAASVVLETDATTVPAALAPVTTSTTTPPPPQTVVVVIRRSLPAGATPPAPSPATPAATAPASRATPAPAPAPAPTVAPPVTRTRTS